MYFELFLNNNIYCNEAFFDMKKPNFFKRMIMLSVLMWRVVMNVKYNPLKYVPCPKLQAYFMLVLFVIWSVFFGFIASVHLGLVNYSTVTSIIIHLSVLVPLVIQMLYLLMQNATVTNGSSNGRPSSQNINYLQIA